MTDIKIKGWFSKNLEREMNAYIMSVGEVERETEKACLFVLKIESKASGEDFIVKKWVPKSCTCTAEEKETELGASADRYQNACDRYDNMIKFAKENGIKGVRVGMKKDTVMLKLSRAGLEYAY